MLGVVADGAQAFEPDIPWEQPDRMVVTDHPVGAPVLPIGEQSVAQGSSEPSSGGSS